MSSLRSIAALAIVFASTPSRADDPDDATVHPAPESDPPPPKRTPTGSFQLGAGFSSDEGFIARATISQSNLFNTGRGLMLSSEIGALHQSFVLQYDVPLGDGFDLRGDLYAIERKYPGFDRKGEGPSLTLGKQLGRSTRAFVHYRLEEVDVTPDASNTASRMAMPLNLGNGLIASLGAGIAYDTRDGLGLHGDRLELFAESADPRLGSDYQFMRAGVVGDHAQPLGPFTLRLHGHATYIETRDPRGVPLSERLFQDGYGDVRGYGMGSIGTPLGDNFEAIGRAELELPVLPSLGISVAGFADAGLRYNTDASFGPVASTLYRSVGASLIWRSPIGPLRFDWALPLDAKGNSRSFLFNLGFGF
jgi:outer membrane protein insertion porin family